MIESFGSAELKEEPFIKETPNNCSKVKVALRVRPMVHKELMEGSLKCIECIPHTSQVLFNFSKKFLRKNIHFAFPYGIFLTFL